MILTTESIHQATKNPRLIIVTLNLIVITAFMTDRRDLYPTTGCARVLPCPASSDARHGRRWTDSQGTIHSIPYMCTQTPSLLCPFPSLLFFFFYFFPSLLSSFSLLFLFLSFPLVRNISRHDNAIENKFYYNQSY